uniref:Uncharacterized protein n=1 Tax=Arundo donax TaxID=35708 RepID=A0A0A9GVA7_ARUDO
MLQNHKRDRERELICFGYIISYASAGRRFGLVFNTQLVSNLTYASLLRSTPFAL